MQVEKGGRNVWFFQTKGGRDEEEKGKATPIDMLSLLSDATSVKKVVLSIIFFHSLFLVNSFSTFDHIVEKYQDVISYTLHFFHRYVLLTLSSTYNEILVLVILACFFFSLSSPFATFNTLRGLYQKVHPVDSSSVRRESHTSGESHSERRDKTLSSFGRKRRFRKLKCN